MTDAKEAGPSRLNSVGKLLDAGLSPRLLTREQAAAYCGLSATVFSRWIKAGRIPAPISGTARWDKKALDVALDTASGLNSHDQLNALDNWRARHARDAEGHS